MTRPLAMVLAGLFLTAVPVVQPTRDPPVFYFVATAERDGIGSRLSVELAVTNVLRARYVVLAWDPSVSTGRITYLIWRGRQSGYYTTNFDVGTNLTATIPFYPPQPTNRVVIFSASCNVVWTNLSFTNTQGNLFLRSSTSLQRGIWTVRAEAANAIQGPWASWSAFWPTWTSTTNPGNIKLGVTHNVVW